MLSGQNPDQRDLGAVWWSTANTSKEPVSSSYIAATIPPRQPTAMKGKGLSLDYTPSLEDSIFPPGSGEEEEAEGEGEATQTEEKAASRSSRLSCEGKRAQNFDVI